MTLILRHPVVEPSKGLQDFFQFVQLVNFFLGQISDRIVSRFLIKQPPEDFRVHQ